MEIPQHLDACEAGFLHGPIILRLVIALKTLRNPFHSGPPAQSIRHTPPASALILRPLTFAPGFPFYRPPSATMLALVPIPTSPVSFNCSWCRLATRIS